MAEFQRLLKAAMEGDAKEMEQLVKVNPDVLCEKTEVGNTCLHIASLCGHQEFCSKVLMKDSSLLSITNNDNETPLLFAVKSGRYSLASHLLGEYSKYNLNQALLTPDRHGCNVLHHAIRNGNEDLAVELIQQQPALAASHNERNESPMFIAVLKGFKKVYDELLRKENSAYVGAFGYNALHAAIKYGNKDFVEQLVDNRPDNAKDLAKEEDSKGDTPMHLAAHFNRHEILKIMLECDRSLGYTISNNNGTPLLYTAAQRGHVSFARALLEHCPDAPYCNKEGRTCLHEAVENDQIKFVEFILEKNSKLGKLVNMLDGHMDESALHMAVKKCNPKMVSALLDHPDIDISVINKDACTAIWKLHELNGLSKTINWVRMLSTNL